MSNGFAGGKKLSIYFDMDGVLADFDLSRRLISVRGDTNKRTEMLSGDAKAAKIKKWLDIEKTPGFWEDMAEMPGARGMVGAAASAGEVFVLTKMPGAGNFAGGEAYAAHIAVAKRDWISRHFGDLFKPENVIVVHGAKEDAVRPSPDKILIDDREENVAGWIASGGRGAVFRSAEQIIDFLRDFS